MTGKLIGVGVGPGDPELLTLKAIRLIKDAELLAYTVDTAGNNYARKTAEAHIRAEQRELPLILINTPDPEKQTENCRENAQKVLEVLNQDLDVVFISEGHPLFYSTFIQLMEEMPRKVDVQVCPGISSIDSASADAHFPLASEDQRLVVSPARQALGHLQGWLKQGNRVVLLKISDCIEAISAELKSSTLPLETVLVERASRDVVACIRGIEEWEERDPTYISLILIRPI